MNNQLFDEYLITRSNFIDYNTIPSNPSFPTIVIYKNIFGGKLTANLSKLDGIIDKKLYNWIKPFSTPITNFVRTIKRITSYTVNNCIINERSKPKLIPTFLAITSFGNDRNILIRMGERYKNIKLTSGSLMFIRNDIEEEWNYIIRKGNSITLTFQEMTSIDIFRNNSLRILLSYHIQKTINYPNKLTKQKIPFSTLKNLIDLKIHLGSGNFGAVYLGCVKGSNYYFAVKLAVVESNRRLYSKYHHDWKEVLLLNNVIKPIVEDGICPNLPLLIDTCVCTDCDIKIRNRDGGDKYITSDCIVTITELADGDLRDFLKFQNPSEDEIYSALFQIMAGLHAIQMSGQIMNFDIKVDNILYYSITPGGYWHYIINGVDFYVPNYGKLFFLNDFGVSRSLSPNHKMYRKIGDNIFKLGKRFGVVMNGIIEPIISSGGKLVEWNNQVTTKSPSCYYNRFTTRINHSRIQLSSQQKRFLEDGGIQTNPGKLDFYSHPLIIPPFEFYNDLQDVIRSFIGGKRTTQRGDHTRYPAITDSVYNKIKEYEWNHNSSNDNSFSTYPKYLLANYFIEEFFVIDHPYTTRLCGIKLGEFNMSNLPKSTVSSLSPSSHSSHSSHSSIFSVSY